MADKIKDKALEATELKDEELEEVTGGTQLKAHDIEKDQQKEFNKKKISLFHPEQLI